MRFVSSRARSSTMAGLSQERLARVRFLEPKPVTDNQAFAGDPDVRELVDRAALCERLRMATEAHFTPLVEVLHAKSRLSRNALWRLVGDSLGAMFLNAGQRFDRLEDAKAAAMAILKQDGIRRLPTARCTISTSTVRDESGSRANPVVEDVSGARGLLPFLYRRGRASVLDLRPAGSCRARHQARKQIAPKAGPSPARCRNRRCKSRRSGLTET